MDQTGKKKHDWKQRLKIMKIGRFEASEHLGPQSSKIYRRLYSSAESYLCPPPYIRLQDFATLMVYTFVSFQQITLKLRSFAKELCSEKMMDFP